MPEVYANNVAGKLAADITATQTNISLEAGHTFPNPGSNWYRATLFSVSVVNGRLQEFGHEVVKIVALAGDTLTVERALEGTAQPMRAGDFIEHRLTAAAISSLVPEAPQDSEQYVRQDGGWVGVVIPDPIDDTTVATDTTWSSDKIAKSSGTKLLFEKAYFGGI